MSLARAPKRPAAAGSWHPGHIVSLAVLFSVAASLPAFSESTVEESTQPAGVATRDDGATPEDTAAVDHNAAAVDHDAAALERDGPVFEIGQITLDYREPHANHPSLAKIFPHSVELQAMPSGYVSPRPGAETERVTLTGSAQSVMRFHASALATLSRSLLRSVQELGLLGVYVLPDDRDIDPQSEADLREAGNDTLRYQVSTGRIKEIRSIAVGDRITGTWVVDHKYHAEIRDESPLQPEIYAAEGTSDLLRKHVLEDYLHRLNRHPGRHVEASLASSTEGDGVALDYRVHESRPFTPYLQVADTGTERTSPWQSRLGFIHRQLTNNDDILNLEYINAGFDDLNGINGSYEAPWFRKKRPRWMKTSGFEPSWLSWFDRDKIPWWGSDHLRWRMSGGFSRVEIGLGELEQFEVSEAITKDWNIGGTLIYETFQHKNLFVDTFIGGRIRQVDFKNTSFSNSGVLDLTTGTLGVELERVNDYSSLRGRFSVELGDVDGSEQDIISQGRIDADEDWVALHWNFGVSHYLEPLFNREAWQDPTTAQSSTLAHEVALSFRGQYAFDYRLIPQVSQVIGGLYSVRGFEQGATVGDSVYIGSAEYRFHLPRALPIRREPLQVPLIGDFRASPQQVYGRPDWDLVLRGFFDLGYSDRNGGKDVNEFDQFLLSAGVGLEATLLGKARVRVDWARGITESSSNSASQIKIDKSGEFHFLFSIMY
ncbi:MAG: ShlB/FhaC/HecB family hemolysin secretion/activation protein [Deltaproteobacteria bacterium]|nr:ShlB/FhaC/HecB family hemolysin secretion/activation protein [Deltaproteobacteria bacterium]MBW2388380.1 ShlB/FhaC/HecB family hemolysin secretion/activation protein [Deltaproteobacteria bacterium]MBW2725369.1 ShlB/FhaC/HecB family hemolysin secretion/activation protein [Deltaproteobacteria bacterium]